MSDAGDKGGKVVNNSSKMLRLAFNDPKDPRFWAHENLGPKTSSRKGLDVDGFRAENQSTTIKHIGAIYDTEHQGYWKITDGMTATVEDDGSSLKFTTTGALPPSKKKESDFENQE